MILFPVRQLISDPFLRTDFDQVGKKKTEDGEKGKERGGTLGWGSLQSYSHNGGSSFLVPRGNMCENRPLL